MFNEYPYVTPDNPNGKSGQKLAEQLLTLIERLPNIKRICELGCGNGYFVRELLARGYEVAAVDSSHSGIEYAKKNIEGKGPVQLICQEISTDLSKQLGSQNFDLVVSIETIEHLYHPSELIEVAATLLRPNGYLLLTTPYHGYLKNLALAITNRMDTHYNPLFDEGHIKFFSVKTLYRIVAVGGFSNIRFEFFGRLPFIWKSMICLAKKEARNY